MTLFNSILTPAPTDGVHTETSDTQAQTESFLTDLINRHLRQPAFDGTPPALGKQLHVNYLARNLFQLPAPFVSLDASRPWMVYWMLHSIDLLGIALDEGTKAKGIETILSFQHPSGGFGGGPGQLAHLLPTYAAVCSLVMLGGGWDRIDREGLRAFFGRMKRANGGFTVCQGGEVDVRGVYCLLVVATLLDLLTPELVENTADFIASCQTFEGGFSASPSSISSTFASAFVPPPPSLTSSTFFPPATPLGEAHGGYTSCSVLSLSLLSSFGSHPSLDKKQVDYKSLLRWSVMMQASAADGAGFKGRANKLVDGCYGWWVGGSFAVLDSLVRPVVDESLVGQKEKADAMLYDRVGLQEYILLLAQHPKGGLADKPPKKADFYHTANNLSGLSLAQHKLYLSPSKLAQLKADWVPSSATGPEEEEEEDKEQEVRRRNVFAGVLGWKEDDGQFLAVGGEQNRVNTTHPSVNVLLLRVEPFVRHFYHQPLTASS